MWSDFITRFQIDSIINENVPNMTEPDSIRKLSSDHNTVVLIIESPIKENIRKTFMITNKQTWKNIEKL